MERATARSTAPAGGEQCLAGVAALGRLLTTSGRAGLPQAVELLRAALDAEIELVEPSDESAEELTGAVPAQRGSTLLALPLRARGGVVGVLTLDGAPAADSPWITHGLLGLVTDLLALALAPDESSTAAKVAQLAELEDDERAALAGDVHDTLVQSLIATRYLLDLMGPRPASEQLAQVRDALQNAIRDGRRLITTLRPRGREGDLAAALTAVGDAAVLSVTVAAPEERQPITAPLASAACRFVQAVLADLAAAGVGAASVRCEPRDAGWHVVVRPADGRVGAASFSSTARRAARRLALLGAETALDAAGAHTLLPAADRKATARALVRQGDEGTT